jgi:Uma2 family endonuclease
MVAQTQNPMPSGATPAPNSVIYPSSDGMPMAENTLQFEWIVRLKENLDAKMPDFVAGDLLWYPVEGHPEIRVAPDVLVCLGRPKGYRGSYIQFREGGVPPTVVFEVLSPGNSTREMIRKSSFYSQHGVTELIVIDPDSNDGWAFVYRDRALVQDVPSIDGWTSPVLGIRFVRIDDRLEVFDREGHRFLSFGELQAAAAKSEQRALAAEHRVQEADQRVQEADQRVQEADQRVQEADQRAIEAEQRAQRLAERLAALGLDPNAD